MYDADFEQRDVNMAADILPQQETKPTGNDEEDHAARISTHHKMKAQAMHGSNYEGEDVYGVRHRGCESIFQW